MQSYFASQPLKQTLWKIWKVFSLTIFALMIASITNIALNATSNIKYNEIHQENAASHTEKNISEKTAELADLSNVIELKYRHGEQVSADSSDSSKDSGAIADVNQTAGPEEMSTRKAVSEAAFSSVAENYSTSKPAVSVYSAPSRSNTAASAPVYSESVNFSDRTLALINNCFADLSYGDTRVSNCKTGYGGRYANFYYAHNSANAFGNLLSLPVGSTFSITKNGVTAQYVISGKVTYDKKSQLDNNAALRDRLYRAIDTNGVKHSISLQTCAGSYDPAAGTNTHRLYVFADAI